MERELHPIDLIGQQIGSTPLRQWLEESTHTVVIAHKNADGDAVGSMLSWYHRLGHRPTLMLPNGCPEQFRWLEGSENILNGDLEPDRCRQLLLDADLIVGVDFCDLTRIEKLDRAVAESKARKVLIDHHHNPQRDAFDVIISLPHLSSASELCYWVMHHLWGEHSIDQTTARCLYTGICTDTGSFRYNNELPSVYEAAAALARYDIDAAGIHLAIDNTFTEERLRFYGYVLTHRLRVFPESHFSYIFVTRADCERFHMTSSDMEGLVSYNMIMKDVHVGLLIREETFDGHPRNRISFRSKYDVDVNQIARTYFNGGGHTKAAGGYTDNISLEETLTQLENIFVKK